MPLLSDYPRYALQLLRGERSAGERRLAAWRQRDTAPYLGPGPLRVLDLANGRLRPQYTILRAEGHEVFGIDMVNHSPRSRIDHAYRAARWVYNQRLGLPAPRPGGETLTCGDVGMLPFPDASFDLATSIAAFEHFLDVPAVVAELHRVLRPGGVLWISIHLFTSPSGGHNLSFTEYPLRTMPPDVEPWDHLRRRRLPFTVPLNEWRQGQYLAELARHFEVLDHYCGLREGEQWLTPELERELAAYTRDELTCAALVITARKGA